MPLARRTVGFNHYNQSRAVNEKSRPAELEQYLAARNLRLLLDQGVAEVWQRAGRPDSELHGYEFYRLASACVEG
ncbi:MAG: hypothetical protein WB579_07050 [Bryobacteraceae bacterium]